MYQLPAETITDSYNDLTYLDRFVVGEIKNNPRVSFSGLFKRNRTKVPLVGDFVVLNHIARILGREGVLLSKNRAYLALRYSSEYKEAFSDRKSSVLKDILKRNLREYLDAKKVGGSHPKRHP